MILTLCDRCKKEIKDPIWKSILFMSSNRELCFSCEKEYRKWCKKGVVSR